MSGYDGEVRILTRIDNKEVNSQMMQLENRMEKTARKAQDLEAEMRKMQQAKVPTEEYKQLSDKLENAKYTLELYKEALENIPSIDKNNKWGELVAKEEDAYNEILKLKDSLKQPIYMRPEGLYQQLDYYKSRLEAYKSMEDSILSEKTPEVAEYKKM